MHSPGGLFVLAILQIASTERFASPARELRAAQARFETLRRARMPVSHASRGRCDTRIGRFCYWYDSAPPPRVEEARAVRDARERLLATFDSAARVHPRDPWLAGQRVRYLAEADRAAVAERLDCGAERWWCRALRGLALHVQQRYAASDSTFTAALSAMPSELRCQWTDLSLLLNDHLVRAIERLPCAERARQAEMLWRLAQPLWMTEGRDARTEHFARHTMALILDGSANAHGSSWGSDTRELLLRYGWSETFTRSPPEGLASSWSVLGHDREPSWHLVPDISSLATPWIRRDAWHLRAPTARARYAPRHLSAMVDLDHQLVRIPRGDGMQLAVAFQVRDTALARDTVDAALIVEGRKTTRSTFGRRATTVEVLAETSIVSVEVLGRGTRRAARARYSVTPVHCENGWCLSDLLLYSPRLGADSVRLAEALDRAIVRSRLSRGELLGVWWHLTAAAGAPVSVRVSLQPAHAGPLGRVIERLRLKRAPAAVGLRWQAVQPTDTASAHVVLHLPERARGAYRLTLAVHSALGHALTATREIEIVP